MSHRHHPKKVAFTLPPRYSRPASKNELRVADHFADHLDHCLKCNSVIYWQGFSGVDSRELCQTSRRLVHNVSAYLYYHQNSLYSTLDTEQGYSIRIEMPQDLQCIRFLLKAMATTPSRWKLSSRRSTSYCGAGGPPKHADFHNPNYRPRHSDAHQASYGPQ